MVRVIKIFLMSSSALVAMTAPALADPFTIGLTLLINLGPVSPFFATLVGNLILGAIGIGVGLLANAVFTPAQPVPPPSDRQSSVAQSVGARVRFYGTNKVGGTFWFLESKDGTLYKGITLNEGKIDSIQEFWLNDQLVTTDSSGSVLDAPYWRGSLSVASILVRDGSSGQTVIPTLPATFPGLVTAAHRLRGIAYALTIFGEVPRDQIAEVYGNGEPQLRCVIRASLVKLVRTGVIGYSDNPADCIYDYLTGRDDAGFAYGAGYSEDQIDLSSFQAFADLCDELVPLKAGGYIKRYRLWGGYAMNEQMRTTMPRLLACCDGDIYITAAGKVAIRGGKWVPPVLTLDSEKGHIISGEFRRGQSSLAAFNELTITYLEPDLDFQEAEADRWLDTTNLALRGQVLSQKLDVITAPHHAQARRLGKIFTHKRNPRWIGRIITNYYGFNALGEDTCTIKFSPLGIDETFAIESVRFLENFTGVEISVSSLSAEAYAWNAATEEGSAPSIPPDTSTATSLPPPDDIVVSSGQKIVNGVTLGAVIIVTWTEPVRTTLWQEVEYREMPSGDWLPMSVSRTSGYAESGVVDDGKEYAVRVRTMSPAGQAGPWSPIFLITPVADTVPPLALIGAAVTGAPGHANISYTTPDSENIRRVAIYRAPVGVPLDRSTQLVGVRDAAISTFYSYIDGDNVSSVVVNGTFTGSLAGWTPGANWTWGSDRAIHASGANTSISQAWTYSAGTWRWGIDIATQSVAGTGIQPFFGGTGAVGGAAQSGVGTKLWTITPVATNAFVTIFASTFVGSIDNVVVFKETPLCAPQGNWDYYLEPINGSYVGGNPSGPFTVTII